MRCTKAAARVRQAGTAAVDPSPSFVTDRFGEGRILRFVAQSAAPQASIRRGTGGVMEKASLFVAAFLAVLFLQVLHPVSPPIPFWQELCAAIAGALSAGLVSFVGRRLKDRQNLVPRASP
jgi:hypothetical protein